MSEARSGSPDSLGRELHAPALRAPAAARGRAPARGASSATTFRRALRRLTRHPLGSLLLVALLLPLLSARPAHAATVAVVLDRSASLRYADPQGAGLERLAQALALALRPGDRLVLFSDSSENPAPQDVTQDPRALAQLLKGVLSATPRAGGADLRPRLVKACEVAGADGVVLVYGDDDLDVIDARGEAPADALRAASEETDQPARDAVNRAAREILRRDLAAVRPAPRLVALTASLPAGAKGTPYLALLGAKVVRAQDADAGSKLAEAIRGAPVVGQTLEIAPSTPKLELPYPARVVLRSDAPLALEGGVQLDGAGKLWLAELGDAPLVLPSGRTRTVFADVAPLLRAPQGLRAYRLADGTVRVLAAGPLAVGEAAVLREGRPRPLAKHGEAISLDLTDVPSDATELPTVTLLRAAGQELTSAAAPVAIVDARARVVVAGTPRVGAELTLTAQLPEGLHLAALDLDVQEGGGAPRALRLSVKGQEASGRYLPRAPGALAIRSRAPIALSLAKPLEIEAAARYSLRISELKSGEQVVDIEHPLVLATEGALTLEAVLSVDPAPSGPVKATLELEGLEGASVSPSEVELGQAKTVTLTLTLPRRDDLPALALKLSAPGTGVQPASRPLPIAPPKSWLRQIIALALLLLALLWIVLLWWARRREKVFVDVELASKQLRTVGTNGRLSPERYRLKDFLISEEEGIFVEPDESPGGALLLNVRKDGKVECTAQDGAKLIHEDRPTVLADKIVLDHGTGFAMVSGQRALRYVYLSDDPDGDELQKKYFGDGVSYEGEVRDSGVFVLLDDDQSVPKASARMMASTDLLFPSSAETFESSHDDLSIVPEQVSDEGIVFMTSDEGEILDSQDVDFLEETRYDVDSDVSTSTSSAGLDSASADASASAAPDESAFDGSLSEGISLDEIMDSDAGVPPKG